jgi:hypothetical protein
MANEIVNYINNYIHNNEGLNMIEIPYFEEPDLINIVSNYIGNNIIVDDVIIIDTYYIYIINNKDMNVWTIYIVDNELITPSGPL